MIRWLLRVSLYTLPRKTQKHVVVCMVVLLKAQGGLTGHPLGDAALTLLGTAGEALLAFRKV